MNVDEFRQYLTIDKNNLDTEIVQQPELLFAVSEAYAEAATQRDSRKEALATIDAQLDISVREELKGSKFTEATVESRVQIDRRHETAFKDYLDAKHRADVLVALKEAFHQRGYLIRDLAALFNANYFETNAVKDTSATDEAVYRRNRQRLAQARERRK